MVDAAAETTEVDRQVAGARLVPAIKYPDVDAAQAFFRDALGFEDHILYRDDDGNPTHVEMTYGSAMVMFGGGGPVPAADAPSSPIGVYVVVDDADAAHARAVAAGADPEPIRDTDYGSREFTVRDPGGYWWSLGTYDPWAQAPDEV